MTIVWLLTLACLQDDCTTTLDAQQNLLDKCDIDSPVRAYEPECSVEYEALLRCESNCMEAAPCSSLKGQRTEGVALSGWTIYHTCVSTCPTPW